MLPKNIKSEDTGGNRDGLQELNAKGIQTPSCCKPSSAAVLPRDNAEHDKIMQVPTQSLRSPGGENRP